MAMTEQGIYTASHDKTVKRWKPKLSPPSKYDLEPELEVKLKDSATALLFSGGWLFVGLWDGQVQAFAQSGEELLLTGHRKRVTTLVVHQGVLMSGSYDGEVRLWQMDPATKQFKCTHTLEESLPGSISKIHVLGNYLFVGGQYGLALLDLTSLKVAKLLPPTKAVADMLEFQGHVIVAYSEGQLRIFDAEGTLKSETSLDAGPILKLAGLESGPRVVCGHARGQVSLITLPSFEFKAEFQALQGQKVDSLLCAGHDGIFLIGSQDGGLQLWQRVEGGLPG
ncbi:ZFWD3 [Symbiodinium natans]|uniref:ZFWD3 protein n=1 Tax=Symbiodinium natans TaxID=878477 RepID=A0A812J4R9_9DINO|nr:ZFWD3 [Symbiodinium natans]